MSKFSDLIKNNCPNGVIYKKLSDVADISIGEFVHKNRQNDNSEYPVYNGGISNTGFYDEYNNDGKNVIISARGANAGFVNRVYGKYWAGNSCYSIKVKDENEINWIYLYHYLKKQQKNLLGEQQTGSIPAVSKKQVENLKIALPNITVQNEIVRILDKFGDLEIELEKELDIRKKQFALIRNKFITNTYESIKISEITNSVSSGKCSNRNENGDFPVYGSTGIISRTDNYAFDTDKILVARVGANAGFVHIATGKYDVTDNTLIVDLKDNIDLKYIYYFLQNFNLNKLAKGGGQPLITGGQIKDIDLNLPPYEEQKRVSSILNKFDTYINSLDVGLPAEIEIRKKQYEYYRGQLLNFKELNDYE